MDSPIQSDVKVIEAPQGAGVSATPRKPVSTVQYILIIVAFVVISVYSYVLMNRVGKLPINTVSKEGLTKVSETKYDFYYPDGYKKVEKQDVKYMFSSTKVNSLKGYDSINLVETKQSKSKLNESICKEFYDRVVERQLGMYKSKFTLLESKLIKNEGLQGCHFVAYVNMNTEVFILDQKFYNRANTTDYYVVTVSYVKGSADAEKLLRASEAFTLK